MVLLHRFFAVIDNKRKPMHFTPSDQEFEAILKLDSHKRFDYCLKKIVDWGEVWTLEHNGMVVYEDSQANKYCPIWPARKFCENAIADDWINAKAICIKIEVFMKEYLSKLTQERISLAMLPNTKNQAVCLTTEEIKAHIQEEQLKY